MISHITNKSIAGFTIFNNDAEYSRFIMAMKYYQFESTGSSFSKYLRDNKIGKTHVSNDISAAGRKRIVQIITYCVMPTHFHFNLKELAKGGIFSFTNNLLNSYSRYFNFKHRRKGPLWEKRSKQILIESDEQLLHLTRYIHLNPVTAYLVDKPEDWPYSSYREYLGLIEHNSRICNYSGLLKIDPKEYKTYVESGIGYQREQAIMKKAENLLR